MVNVCDAIERDQSRISAAISEAEARTSGEILVCVVRRAGRYGREEGALGLIAGLILYTCAWLAYPDWTTTRSWATLLFALGIFAAGYLGAALFPDLAVLLSSSRVRQVQAEERAAVQFHRLHVENTRAHTGVLIFIAQAEHTVVVLGDAPIARKLLPKDWEAVRDPIMAGIRSGKVSEGIQEGVSRAGDLLGTHFPPGTHDRNELPNDPCIIR